MQEEIQSIKARNARVEADKAWETSATRKSIIAVMTYFAVVVFLHSIGAPNPWLSEFVTAVGYLLSTLTLPFFKKWWINSIYKK